MSSSITTEATTAESTRKSTTSVSSSGTSTELPITTTTTIETSTTDEFTTTNPTRTTRPTTSSSKSSTAITSTVSQMTTNSKPLETTTDTEEPTTTRSITTSTTYITSTDPTTSSSIITEATTTTAESATKSTTSVAATTTLEASPTDEFTTTNPTRTKFTTQPTTSSSKGSTSITNTVSQMITNSTPFTTTRDTEAPTTTYNITAPITYSTSTEPTKSSSIILESTATTAESAITSTTSVAASSTSTGLPITTTKLTTKETSTSRTTFTTQPTTSSSKSSTAITNTVSQMTTNSTPRTSTTATEVPTTSSNNTATETYNTSTEATMTSSTTSTTKFTTDQPTATRSASTETTSTTAEPSTGSKTSITATYSTHLTTNSRTTTAPTPTSKEMSNTTSRVTTTNTEGSNTASTTKGITTASPPTEIACDPGHYKEIDSHTCLQCPIGTYQNQSGSLGCINCSEGEITLKEGSPSVQYCLHPCAAGYYHTSNVSTSSICVPCPKDHYQPMSGQSRCLTCDESYTTFVTGSTRCSNRRFLFGLENGDTRLNINEDACSEKINIVPFRVFGQKYEDTHICTNGIISLNFKYTNPNPPMTKISGFSFLAAYYTDIDLGISGTAGSIYYQVYDVIKNRNMSMHENVLMAQNIIRDAENMPSFVAKIMLIVTWHDVHPFLAAERYNEKASFQASVVTNGVDTYFLSFYFMGKMHFTKGTVFIGYNLFSGQYTKHLTSNTTAALTPDKNIVSNGIQGLLFYRLSSVESKIDEEIACLEMFEERRNMVSSYAEKEKEMPECPCTLDLLNLDEWFADPIASDENTICSKIRPALWFRPYGKTCCYDNETGTYLILPPRAGGFLTRHPVTRKKEYDAEDVTMKKFCCEKSEHCDLYYLLHPVGKCYSKLPSLFGFSWGDPHIQTLDGFNYTFNGWGEYTLVDLDTGNTTFILQARTEPAVTTNNYTNATIFSAFAASDEQNASVHIELNRDKNGLIIYGNRIDYTSNFIKEEQYILETDTLTAKKQKDNATINIMFPSSGISLNISLGIKMLTLGISIPRRYYNNTRGLLGNFNGDPKDDLMFPNGTKLDVNATEQHIFHYSQTWRIASNESLFIYPSGKNSTAFDHADFVPMFLDKMNDAVVSGAEIFCREHLGNADIRTCVFDLVFTNNTAIAIDTGNVDQRANYTYVIAENSAPIIFGDNVLNVTLNETLAMYVNFTDDDVDSIQIELFINNANASLNRIDNKSALIVYTPISYEPKIFRTKVTDKMGAIVTQDIVFRFCTGCSGHGYCDYDSYREDNRSTIYFKYARCICHPQWQGENCEKDLDGCLLKPCSHGRNCTDVMADKQLSSNRSYICSNCPNGYNETGDKCTDINECDKNITICDQACNNIEGSYFCSCYRGYRLHVDGRTCRDVNECDEYVDNCQHECTNTNGSFNCSCYQGYNLDLSSDQCKQETIPNGCTALNCSETGGCKLTQNGNATCFCDKGYSLSNSQQCVDIDECQRYICSMTCENTQGSYRCTCPVGYQLAEDKVTCIKCPDLKYGYNCSLTCLCERGAVACNHITGCVCEGGWTGIRCSEDIDECNTSLYNCGEDFENKECVNVLGSYECRCKYGLQKHSNGSCIDIDECSRDYNNRCEQNQRCENVWGNYTCSCEQGFLPDPLNKYLCKDIDECVEGSSGCEQICNNVPGRFNCYCGYGYSLDTDRKRCVKDFDPCKNFNSLNCSDICLIKNNSQECNCRLGYYLDNDKQTCNDINECLNTTLNRCNPHAICTNMAGGYACKCPLGQKLENDGRTCKVCDDYHYGENCAKECGCSSHAKRCDPISGCECAANWTGSRCETQIECADGRNNCSGRNNECVSSSGMRLCKCKAGYKTSNHFYQDCLECENNTFGQNCLQLCKCFEKNVISISKMCDPSSGLCICNKGWRGDCSEDIDECLEDTHNCINVGTSVCQNVPGGFECNRVDKTDLILILGISIPCGLLLLVLFILIICLVRRKLNKSIESPKAPQRSRTPKTFSTPGTNQMFGQQNLDFDGKFNSQAVLISGVGSQPSSVRTLPKWVDIQLPNDVHLEKFKIKRPKFNPVQNPAYHDISNDDAYHSGSNIEQAIK